MSDNYQPKLGKLCTETDRRDAVHIALAPVVAGGQLHPGERVVLRGSGQFAIAYPVSILGGDENGTVVGVVDPFLLEPVKRGERFWLMLLPGTITGLRHVWQHPAFKVAVPHVKE